MAKFVFKFQTILELKIQIEENLKNELGKAIQKLELEKEILRGIEQEREASIDEFNEVSSQGTVVEKLREYTSYISYLKGRIELQKENVNYAQNDVDRYREQLIAAMQEREMLEKLREKKHEEYMKEQLKQEQKEIDEVVSFKYAKRLNNGL